MKTSSQLKTVNTDQARQENLIQPMNWIDAELKGYSPFTSNNRWDTLLELRQLLTSASPNKVVFQFYQLLPKIENTHFLLSYRIRQWLSLSFEVLISDPLHRVESKIYPIKKNARSLKHQQRDFFENTKLVIPHRDLRIQIKEISI